MDRVLKIAAFVCLSLLALGLLRWFPELTNTFRLNALWPFLYGVLLVTVQIWIILRYGTNHFETNAKFIQLIGFALSLESIRAFVGFYATLFEARNDNAAWYRLAICIVLGFTTNAIPWYLAAKRYWRLHAPSGAQAK